jgi:hypothetical protein
MTGGGRAVQCNKGLLSSLERKNGWSLAEFAGVPTPDGMQRLLDHARRDAHLVQDGLRRQAGERIGSLVGGDTGLRRRAGVRLGCNASTPGTVGEIMNHQIGCSAPT